MGSCAKQMSCTEAFRDDQNGVSSVQETCRPGLYWIQRGVYVALSQGNLTFVLLRDCLEELRWEYVLDLLSGTLKGCSEHICAIYYWQASQRNSHVIWNPGVVGGTGRGLIPAKLGGMLSAHHARSQPNRLFAGGPHRVTWWDMPNPTIKARLWQWALGEHTYVLGEHTYYQGSPGGCIPVTT